MVRELLLKLADEFPIQRRGPFKGNSLLQFVSSEIPSKLYEVFSSGLNYVSWRASVGLGKWSEIPWIAALDSRVTTTTMKGFYVVLLYTVGCEELYLGVQLGTEDLRDEFGTQESRHIMADWNAEITSFINAAFPRHAFAYLRPELGGNSERTRSYEDAFSIGKHYVLRNFPDETHLVRDISAMLQIYQSLVAAQKNGEILGERSSYHRTAADSIPVLITEKGQYKIHLAYERNSRAAREAKRFHGHVCQVCGFDFGTFYGDVGSDFIEAHHIRPLSDLVPGEELQYNVKTDFAVLCSNCHRMVHRQSPPLSIAELRRRIERAKK